ncbi:YbaB/EbfC family nucleoid-associated protein [Mycoplasma sp. P36-A1]|uniref:YbaB/EbfC family nucleoid-associated protein n=1 Tax=Mycoplasma sp. P36-A1 TaxID=3252900 RepID=UPI003C2BD659
MNINQMMKQAQQMQAKVAKAQAELEEKEFEKEVNQAVKVKVNGKKQVLKVEIDEDLLEADNKEILEDMIVVALNDVFKEVDTLTDELMTKATGNMKIPGF